MNLAQLLAEAREVATRQAARLQTAIDANRELTAEEEAAHQADATRLTDLQAQIQRAQDLQARLSAVPTFPAPTTPAAPASPGARAEPRAREPGSGFRNIAEFGQAVRLANPAAGSAHQIDPRLAAPTNVVGETGDAAGSYAVPADIRDEVVDLVQNAEDGDAVVELIAAKPTSSNRVGGLGSQVTPWGTDGVQARWRVEGTQMTPSRTGVTPRETKLNELYAFVLATEEALEDAPRLQQLLTVESAAAIRWKTGEAYMNGDGVEKPLGWMESGALVTVSKENAQAADTIEPMNVAKMYSRMINPQQAVWMANSDIMPQIMGFENAAGQQLWQADYRTGPGGTLLGRPIHFTEHAQTLGDKGDLQFVNPRGYEAWRKQNGVTFAESIHLYFDYNIRAFRWIFRIGGQPLLAAPVAPAHGNATKSHFVALEARA